MSESLKGLHRTCRCAEISSSDIGKEVTVCGWVQKIRNKGGLIFIDLRDRSGIIQILLNEETSDKDLYAKASGIKQEFVLAVVGTVEKRGGETNDKIATGSLEIIPKEIRILAECDVLPFQIEDETNTREELRLKYRYLDLRRSILQKNLMLRSKVAVATRKFFSENGFLEIETPTFIKSTPEGARDYLVPSRVWPGKFYALPQSPQLYKQLLMVAGCDRYFQIARCYRDEDLRADRQPEFTQIDLEMSFIDIEDVLEVNERFLKYVFKEVLNVDVKLPIERMKWIDCMNNYGSDKPDTRFDMKLIDVTDVVRNTEFKVFTDAISKKDGAVKGINVKGQAGMPRKKIDALVEKAKECGAGGLCYLAIEEDGNIKSSFTKFLKEDEINNLIEKMDGKKGDLLLIAADKINIVWNTLGTLRLFLGKELDLIDKNAFNFLWVTEFPLLEWDEEEGRYVAMHHPFTMVMDEDVDLLFNGDAGKARAKAYDIVLNGNEIGGGSIRIHQPEIQSKMFEVIGFTKDEALNRFGFLLDAFKYGVPPHGGLAYGLDRLCMIMCGSDSIRDCIAFPKTKDATCLMVNTPCEVDEKQLIEDHICVRKEENK